MKTFMIGCFSIAVLMIVSTFCLYLHGYATGNHHAHQFNFNYYRMKFDDTDDMRLFWYKQVATDKMIDYVESLDSVTKIGYTHGVKITNKGLGLVVEGYVYETESTMRRGYEKLTAYR